VVQEAMKLCDHPEGGALALRGIRLALLAAAKAAFPLRGWAAWEDSGTP
jgi:hypothetical protein